MFSRAPTRRRTCCAANLDPPDEAAPCRQGSTSSPVKLEALDVFKLAIAGVTFTKERLAASLAEAKRWSKVNELGEVVEDIAATGSNNWAIHGSRTASGRPIVANDPHRAHAVPSLRYLVHLSAPGFDAHRRRRARGPRHLDRP